MAASTGVAIVDEDDKTSDWLEIHNTGAISEPLGGYRLTDDADDLAQWTLPNISIPTGVDRGASSIVSGAHQQLVAHL